MSKGKTKLSLHSLTREPLRPEEHPELLSELLSGTDRSTALVGCAMVDAALVVALTTRFVAMDGDEFNGLFYSQNGPLFSFAARIKIGRAIGIYGAKLQRMMNTIRQVRNVFAHSVRPLTFANDLVAKECALLPDAKLKPELEHSLHPLRERYIAARW